MLVGLPGAGKSFFARQFSEMFGAPLVSTDRLRFELFPKPGFTTNEYELVRDLANIQITELLKTKTSIVIDGPCNAKTERQNLALLAKKAGYNCLTIWVQTDGPTAKFRATKRSPRRTDDKHSPSLTNEQFTSLAKLFTPPTTEDYIVISGKHAYRTQATMVLRRLTAPRATEAENAYKRDVQEERRSAPIATKQPSREAHQPRRSVLIS